MVGLRKEHNMDTTAKDQAVEKVIEWARMACEETRAKVGFHDPEDEYKFIPSWLPELETALESPDLE